MAWRGAAWKALSLRRRGARRLGYALAALVVALGLYDTVLAYLVPINLAEARNFGDELCLMASTGLPARVYGSNKFEYAEGLDDKLAERLREMAPALGERCHVIVEPGDLDAGRVINFGVVLGLIAYGGHDAISIQLYRDPLFTPLLGYLTTGTDPTKGLFHICCYADGHAVVRVIEDAAKVDAPVE